MKKCPFCAEEIQDTAVKCRYCGEWLEKKDEPLNTPIESSTAQQSTTAAQDEKKCPDCTMMVPKESEICPCCGKQFLAKQKK